MNINESFGSKSKHPCPKDKPTISHLPQGKAHLYELSSICPLMPVCVHCKGLVPYVYTVYSSKDNVRLAVCVSPFMFPPPAKSASAHFAYSSQEQCHLFADPLIEHPLVLLLIDLILLKPRIYRHLVFNRGSWPYQAGKNVLKGGSTGGNEILVVAKVGYSEVVDELTRVTAVNHDRREVSLNSLFPRLSSR